MRPCLFLAIVAASVSPAFAAHYQLIVRNGTVIDGTGAPRVREDVAVNAGKIAAIGDCSKDDAGTTIDAAGLIVAPGFIDVHTHVDDDIFKYPLAENFVRDGVTTIVSGNCGSSVEDIGAFFDRVAKEPAAVNHATLYGHNTLLRILKGGSVAGALTPDQITRGQQLVEKAMRDGAIGFSTGLIYTPGTWASTDEIIALAKPAGALGCIYTTHMRSEGNGIVDAINEALRVGKEGGFPRVEISHFKISTTAAINMGRGKTVDHGSDLTLAMVERARAAGQEVWLDQYPYTASSTTLSVMLPDWVLEKGPAEAKRILTDVAQLSRVLADMRQNHEVENHRTDLSYAVVASAPNHPEYAGKSVKQIAQMLKAGAATTQPAELMGDAASQPADVPVTMEDQYRAVIHVYLGGGASCVFHGMDEGEVANIMRSPLVGVASDSGIRVFGAGVPHPRGYGTNCRVLGHYVRDLHVISLEEAVRKMTSLPAHSFRMDGRGAIAVGNFADLTIFDAGAVSDKATYDHPHQYSVGVRHVLTNGVEVFDGERMTGQRSGMPIYGPAKQ